MKNKNLVEQVKYLKENYTESEYDDLLEKVLKSGDGEAMFLMVKYFPDCPIDMIEEKIYQIKDFRYDGANTKMGIEINSLTHNEYYTELWWSRIVKLFVNYWHIYSDYLTVDELLDIVSDYASLDGVDFIKVYNYLKTEKFDTTKLLQKGGSIDLEKFLNCLNSADEIYNVALLYREYIDDEMLLKFTQKFMKILSEIYDYNIVYTMDLFYMFIGNVPNLKSEHLEVLVGDPFKNERLLEDYYEDSCRKYERQELVRKEVLDSVRYHPDSSLHSKMSHILDYGSEEKYREHLSNEAFEYIRHQPYGHWY